MDPAFLAFALESAVFHSLNVSFLGMLRLPLGMLRLLLREYDAHPWGGPPLWVGLYACFYSPKRCLSLLKCFLPRDVATPLGDVATPLRGVRCAPLGWKAPLGGV
jgi:hypothetical protein